MSKKTILSIAFILILIASISFILAISQCSDGIDNDLDGKIDYPADNGCDDSDDRTESKVLGYQRGCLNDGDVLKNVFGEVTYECEHDLCLVCVLMTEAGNYTTNPSKCDGPQCEFGNGGGGSIDVDPPNLTVNSPVDDFVYNSRKVLFDIESDEYASLYYIDNINGRGRWKRLSGGTKHYSREISLKDGLNDLTIKGGDDDGNEAFVVKQFYVDSKKPKIKKTYPKKGFANGVFEVQFQEENPETLTLYYGNGLIEMREAELNIEECIYEKRRYSCSVEVDVNDYDGMGIEYWFELTDIANTSAESKHVWLSVDTTFPVLNNPGSFWTQGEGRYNKYIYFNLLITEENFDEVSYIDWEASRPKWRRLCTRLKDGMCVKRKTFRIGHHVVDVQIIDEAGNAIAERIEFEVDY